MSKRLDASRIVIASGYFSPGVHVGHIAYLRAAKTLGKHLFVIVNNNAQLLLKGRPIIVSEQERLEQVAAIRWVDGVQLSIDQDRSVNRTLRCLHFVFPNLIFANGGDVDLANCREKEVCEELGIAMVFGVGGCTKKQSSSEIISRLSAGHHQGK